MQSVYIGTTSIVSFETIKKTTTRITSPWVLISRPRVILKVLMDLNFLHESYSYYINPAKITESEWTYITKLKENHEVIKVSLYLAEKTDVFRQKIPKLERLN